MSSFTLKGVRSESMGLVVQRFPDQPKPRRKVTKVSIPGRNGDLRIADAAWENVSIAYDCYFKGGPEQASRIAEWLYGSTGYANLKDDYSGGVFRKAAFDGPMGIENVLNRYGRVTVTFDAMPQIWLDSGMSVYTFSPGSANSYEVPITNPTAQYATPWLRLSMAEGQTEVSIRFYRQDGVPETMKIKGIDRSITIDSESMVAYKGGTSLNSLIVVAGRPPIFPLIAPGKGKLIIDGPASGGAACQKIEVLPRWWTL